MRSIWTGHITFGLITIPVSLYTAVSNHRVEFSMLHGETGNRIKFKRVDEQSGDEVPWDAIVKGYEIDDGQFVTFTHDELDELDVESLREIDIDTFVDQADIDPIHYNSTYYIAPGDGGSKAYHLLVRALSEGEKVGIAKFAMRQKEHLAALRTDGTMLLLETMHWPAEIRDPTDIKGIGDRAPAVREKEVDMALNLIDQLSGKFEPHRYRNTFEQHVRSAAKKKLEGKEITVTEEVERPQPVSDLMAALEASLSAARSGKKAAPTRSKAKKDGAGKPQGRKWLLDHTKEELLDLAQDNEIAGRSKMSKDELVDALVK